MADDDDNLEPDVPSCKVVLLGEAGVGKTSIISSFITKKFDEKIMTTTGASFASKTIKIDKCNEELKFEIWDTAGQEVYRSLAKIFYKNARIAILVYDITRKESFDELTNYWYPQVKESIASNLSKKTALNSPYLVIAVVANKSDLFDREVVNEETAREFAQDIGALFKTTSAKNSTGVEDLFICLGQKLFDPNTEVKGKEKEVNDPKKRNKKLTLNDQMFDKDGMADKSKCC